MNIRAQCAFVTFLIQLKITSRKILWKCSKPLPVVRNNAANCTLRVIIKKTQQTKSPHKSSINLSSNSDQKIENRSPVFIIIASQHSCQKTHQLSRTSTITSTEIQKKMQIRAQCIYHHCIKKHICHQCNWTKTNIKKMLKEISEYFLVVGDNAANFTRKHYKKKFNKQKTLRKPSIKFSPNIPKHYEIRYQCFSLLHQNALLSSIQLNKD